LRRSYNFTTEYYQAKKLKKIPSELGESIQYLLQFKLWLVARSKKEGIRPVFRSVGVLHNNYYRWKHCRSQFSRWKKVCTIYFILTKKGEIEIKHGPRRILTHTEELELQ
jgi:hypothetical protein